MHAREIRLAVRDVHRAPEHARAERGDDAARGRSGRRVRADASPSTTAPANSTAAPPHHAEPAPRAGAAQLAEQQRAPHDPEQAVRVPERERDGEPDVADRVHGQRVRDRPQPAREQRPHHEMRRARHVRAHAGRAAQQRRQAPAREEHAEHHHQRDRDGRDAERHELRGRLGRAEPRAGGHAREHADRLQAREARGVYASHRKSVTPAASTTSGIQKWTIAEQARPAPAHSTIS